MDQICCIERMSAYDLRTTPFTLHMASVQRANVYTLYQSIDNKTIAMFLHLSMQDQTTKIKLVSLIKTWPVARFDFNSNLEY